MKTTHTGYKKHINTIFILLALPPLLSLSLGPKTAEASVSRIGGSDRYETSARIAESVYGKANLVIVARGDQAGGFTDGLAASVLAGVLDAPVLLTDSNTLPEPIINVITDLGATEVVVLGGSKAISSRVVAALKGLGLSVKRIGGKDRFETAALIAEEAKNRGLTADYAFIVNGFAIADSLVAAPAAFRNGAPILLITRDTIPDVTVNILKRLGISRAYIVGGPAVIGTAVENRFGDLLNIIRRLGGTDRYATSIAFAEELFTGFNDATLSAGRDENLADSTGSCIFGLPLLYVRLKEIPDGIYNYLKTIVTTHSQIRIIGGSAAVDGEINDQLNTLYSGFTAGGTSGSSAGGGGHSRPGVGNIVIETDPADTGNLNNAALVAVTLSTSTAGAKIYYTLDGTPPTKRSHLYDGPFKVTTDNPAGDTIYLKVVGIRPGHVNSKVITKAIVFNRKPADKSLLEAAIYGAANNLGSVEISTDGADVDPANQWVSGSVYNAYNAAISEARKVADDESVTQQEIDDAINALAAATAAFDHARKDGTKPAALRVAVYVDHGANPDKIPAIMRCLQACGFDFGGISRLCIEQGRLHTNNYDVFLIPAGTDDLVDDYQSAFGLGTNTIKNYITEFVKSGGGIVGLENGANFITTGDGNLGLYPGTYIRSGNAGKTIITYDGSFGINTQQVYRTAGGGFVSAPAGTTSVATVSSQPVIAHCSYNRGRVIVTTLDPELRGDTDLDWTRWDNWDMGHSHMHSNGAWELLGRMVNWAGSGVPSVPQMTALSNPAGKNIAVVSTYTEMASAVDCRGGAAAMFLPAVFRSIEYAGHTPLAIRMTDIYNYGGNNLRLKTANFDALVIPGGRTGGYTHWLGAEETGNRYIRNFAHAGGGVMGICAGSFYLSQTMIWKGLDYSDGHIGLFRGIDTGPIDSIAQYPAYALTTIAIDDAPDIGITGKLQQQLYCGGGYKTDQGAATQVATYADPTPSLINAVRLKYRNQGSIFLIGTHPELRCGQNDDWLHWDNYAYNSGTPLDNPDNTWDFLAAVYNNWLLP